MSSWYIQKTLFFFLHWKKFIKKREFGKCLSFETLHFLWAIFMYPIHTSFCVLNTCLCWFLYEIYLSSCIGEEVQILITEYDVKNGKCTHRPLPSCWFVIKRHHIVQQTRLNCVNCHKNSALISIERVYFHNKNWIIRLQDEADVDADMLLVT